MRFLFRKTSTTKPITVSNSIDSLVDAETIAFFTIQNFLLPFPWNGSHDSFKTFFFGYNILLILRSWYYILKKVYNNAKNETYIKINHLNIFPNPGTWTFNFYSWRHFSLSQNQSRFSGSNLKSSTLLKKTEKKIRHWKVRSGLGKTFFFREIFHRESFFFSSYLTLDLLNSRMLLFFFYFLSIWKCFSFFFLLKCFS